LWLHSLKVAQLLRSAACLHTNQSRSYLNHLVSISPSSSKSSPVNFILCFSQNPKNSLPWQPHPEVVLILNQFNPIHTPTPYTFKVPLNNVLRPCCSSGEQLLASLPQSPPVRVQIIPRGNCGGQSGTKTGICPSTNSSTMIRTHWAATDNVFQ